MTRLVTHTHEIVGVVWDVDGTLVDTVPALIAAWTDLFLAHDKTPPHQNKIKAVIGVKPEVAFAQLGWKYSKRLHAEFKTFARLHTNLVKGVPGAFKALTEFRNHSIANAAATSRSDQLAAVLKKSRLAKRHFACIVDGNSPLPSKPNPEALQYIATRLGVSTEQLAVAGDAGTDMQFAINGGALPIGVSLDSNEPVPGAVVTVRSPVDVPEIVLGSNSRYRAGHGAG